LFPARITRPTSKRSRQPVDFSFTHTLWEHLSQVGLRTVPSGFGEVLVSLGTSPTTVEEAEQLVRSRGKEFVQQLQARVAEELPTLPFNRYEKEVA
jgi:hypothetical protein